MPMETYDVIVLGAGAAGLMCAWTAAQRGKSVLVLEQSYRPGPKILVSGGGRCNFTNLYAKPSNYTTSNPGFLNYALTTFKPQNFIALVEEHHIPYHEKKDGQLFCDNSAKDICHLLVQQAQASGTQLLLNQKIQKVSHFNHIFTVELEGTSYQSSRLVVATGGLSWPQLGASDLGFQIAQQFGLQIITPSPALVGLAFPPREMIRFKDLAGIHLRVHVTCGNWNLEEDLMITHKGLSGPVMLNASLFWKPGDEIIINWIPELTIHSSFSQLKRDKAAGGRGQFRIWLSKRLPRRLAERIAWNAQARGPWSHLSDDQLLALATDLNAYRFIPSDTFGYRQAEVMKGGVDTKAISSTTMESLGLPGLYFIGEVLDVTGELGGFNFQWAWSSGWVCGQAV